MKRKKIIRSEELSTECAQLVGMLWRRTLGDESEVIKFPRPWRQI